jgi:dihydrofolate synthase/folylpolyglutamate synthase
MNELPVGLDEWLALLERRHHTAIDLGLDRCREVWLRMGSPLPAAKIIVVAGTNGKGSTVAPICSVLGSLGYSYGCYTTPHIHEYNERVQVNGRNATDDELIESFRQVEKHRGDTSLSYFEFGTLAAFALMAGRGLDFAVMEIGLGGRLDAVNLLDADCAVITPIGLDHQEYLGDTLNAIGREKAGILRPGKPLICGEANPPESVLGKAAELGAPVKRLGADSSAVPAGGKMKFTIGAETLDLPPPALSGPHQFGNTATALAALLELVPEALQQPGLLAAGLAAVDLHGRLERVAEAPDIWIDVGHNALGARAIALALQGWTSDNGGRLHCVLAMLADKDAEAVAGELGRIVDHWYCAGLSGDRGQTGRVLAQRLLEVTPRDSLDVFNTVPEALNAARSAADPEDGILVFGSFLTADEATEALPPLA